MMLAGLATIPLNVMVAHPHSGISHTAGLIDHKDFDKVVGASEDWVRDALSIIVDLEAQLMYGSDD